MGEVEGDGDIVAITMVGAMGAPERQRGRGRNTGCAQGQLVLLVFAGWHHPPDSGRSDDENISQVTVTTPHKMFSPE